MEPRRNFAYDIIGKSFFVHGGVSDHGRTLGDFWELNLSMKIKGRYNLISYGY
jgi:hypothetical protein